MPKRIFVAWAIAGLVALTPRFGSCAKEIGGAPKAESFKVSAAVRPIGLETTFETQDLAPSAQAKDAAAIELDASGALSQNQETALELPAGASPKLETPMRPDARATPLPSAVSGPAFSAEDASVKLGELFDDESVKGKTVLLVGISPSSIMQEVHDVVSKLGMRLVVLDRQENRRHSAGFVPDANFIAAPVDDRDETTMKKIVGQIQQAAKERPFDLVISFSRRLVRLTGMIKEKIGAAGVPPKAVLTAEDKAETRRALNAHPDQFVAYAEPKSAEEAGRSHEELGGGSFMLKSRLGENSWFLQEVHSKHEAETAYAGMDAELRRFLLQEKKRSSIYKKHPGMLMERLLQRMRGTLESSAEVVRQRGKTVFAMLSDTFGIGPRGSLAGGSLTFPSQQSPEIQKEFLAAVDRALGIIGYDAGNARPDVMKTSGGARLIEINPSMGATHVWKAVKILTGVSLIEHAFRAILGLRIAPSREPSGFLDYRFAASKFTGTIEKIEGEEAALAMPGVRHLKLLASVGDRVVAPNPEGNSFEEYIEIMATGDDAAQARERAVKALAKLKFYIREEGAPADAPLAVQTGEYLQPSVD